jgi:tRNA A37 threonylcarbamoyladenosine modification protein TsaB
VAGDARRREVYWAGYREGRRVEGPDVARPAAVATDGFDACAGAGARIYSEVFGLPLLDQDYPDPAALIRAGVTRVTSHSPSERLVPLYLRRPDAVEPGPPKATLV